MRVFLFRSVAGLVAVCSLLAMLSCAHDQQLVGITIKPETENFGAADPALNVQLRALGSYIHPPVTKDITSQVTWASNTPNMVTVTPTGLLSSLRFFLRKRFGFGDRADQSQLREPLVFGGDRDRLYDGKCGLRERHRADTDYRLFGRYGKHNQCAAWP